MAGGWGNNFWQNHWIFRFVILPQEIPDKMKLHLWNFQNLCYTPWKFQCLYLRLKEIPHDFFLITPVNSFSWLLLEFPDLFRNSMSFFFWNSSFTQLHWQLYIFPVSDEWLIFCCRNFILCQKKKFWCRKQHSCLYCELAPLTCDVTCLKL